MKKIGLLLIYIIAFTSKSIAFSANMISLSTGITTINNYYSTNLYEFGVKKISAKSSANYSFGVSYINNKLSPLTVWIPVRVDKVFYFSPFNIFKSKLKARNYVSIGARCHMLHQESYQIYMGGALSIGILIPVNNQIGVFTEYSKNLFFDKFSNPNLFLIGISYYNKKQKNQKIYKDNKYLFKKNIIKRKL
ncbi:hypothetical protein DID75_00955 [Candidatus Marinamargulisbacteria bacterium SCGC AG-410-N11]|nr:hypothetical protein DID75_00955 [Candidatus Marinamargulisbacteria bacterium SCGC AG-410-N11]